MTEQNTEPIEDITEAPAVVSPIEEPPVSTKSRKVRSELQLKALENARQKAYKVRAEKATIKKAKNESKKTPEVSIEFQKRLPEVPEEVPVDSKDVSPENENENKNENIRDVKESETVAEESHTERIERRAERQRFNDHINNLIDERVQYKPIVKGKFKMIDGVYVIR